MTSPTGKGALENGEAASRRNVSSLPLWSADREDAPVLKPRDRREERSVKRCLESCATYQLMDIPVEEQENLERDVSVLSLLLLATTLGVFVLLGEEGNDGLERGVR